MKRITKSLALILALTMGVAVFTACGSKSEDSKTESKAVEVKETDANSTKDSAKETNAQETDSTQTADDIAGGFTAVESPVVTDEVKALVEKAASKLTGAEYTPVAYVATQVVAGTNHLVLCKVAPVVPDAVGHYALVKVYEDLEGDAEIILIEESKTEVPPTAEDGSTLSGGYNAPETPVVTDEAKEALTKACEGLAGAEYEPVALIGEQVVAGINYMMLCKVTTVTEEPQSKYTIVTVYADLDGNASITDTSDFVAAV